MGIGDVAKKALWLFLAASIALAVFRGIPPNPAGWYNWAAEQVQDVQKWADGVGDDINTWVDKQPKPDSILPGDEPSAKPRSTSAKKS